MAHKVKYAFPLGSDWGSEDGMTLRDYFAGQALAGLCANADWSNMKEVAIADAAFEYADAMMETRDD